MKKTLFQKTFSPNYRLKLRKMLAAVAHLSWRYWFWISGIFDGVIVLIFPREENLSWAVCIVRESRTSLPTSILSVYSATGYFKRKCGDSEC